MTIASSGSMEPAITTGSVYYVDTSNKNPSIGDIIEFQPESGKTMTITHRVIAKNTGSETFYITQGDNNDSADGRVYDYQLVGTVEPPLKMIGIDSGPIFVPYVGYVFDFVNHNKLLVLSVLLFGLAAYMIVEFISSSKRRRKQEGNEDVQSQKEQKE